MPMGKRRAGAQEGSDRSEKISRQLKEYSRMDKAALLEAFHVDEDGLTPVEADERLNRYGKNIIEAGAHKSFLRRLADVVINPFNLVLFVVLGITFVTDVMLSAEKDWSTSILIFSTIAISPIVGLYPGGQVQQRRRQAAQDDRK